MVHARNASFADAAVMRKGWFESVALRTERMWLLGVSMFLEGGDGLS